MNIYVGNLARAVTEESLKTLFEGKGEVTSVKILKDKFTGDPRGFGFVDMPNAEEANQAIADLNGYELEGQSLRVNEARSREERPKGGGGRRFGDRGGRGGGQRFDRF